MKGEQLSFKELMQLPSGQKFIMENSSLEELDCILDNNKSAILSKESVLIINENLKDLVEDGEILFYEYIEEPFIDPTFREMLKLVLKDCIKKGEISLEIKSEDCYSHFEKYIALSIDGEILVREYLS